MIIPASKLAYNFISKAKISEFLFLFRYDKIINILSMQSNTTEAENNKNANGGYLKYLPKDPQQRAQLKQAIERSLKRLKKRHEKKPEPQNEQKISILELRVLMIDSCAEMSLLRLDHLQWLFKHYCTHIFRTGKYMTFERLQYEKVHLTMQRFFLFLKDFELTIMKNSDKKEQVIDKNTVILYFKKISSNSRDLSFEEFIRCIQKLAVVYYDQKQIFYKKREKIKQQKQKRKQQYEKKKMMRLKKQNQQNNQENEGQAEGEGQGQGEGQQDENKQPKNKKKQEAEENDQLIKDMLNNKELEDPNQQLNKITNRYAFESDEQPTHGGENNFSNYNDDMLLVLTNQEKIQYFYKFMVKVDSVKDYKDKLTELNLPIFNKGKSVVKTTGNNEEKNIKATEDEHARMQELKKKMDEKKLKQKASLIPKPKQDGAWAQAEEEKKRKRQLKKQRQLSAKEKNKLESDALLQKKLDSQKSVKEKKPQFNDKEVDWNSLGKMSIEQLKINKFNPNRYFSRDDDDKIFLDEYEMGGRQRMPSGLESNRERNSLAVVEDARKRVEEVQRKQRKQQKDLEKKIGQNVPIKNRF